MRHLTDNERYAVLEARPESFSDDFFVGVKSTGIFCRIGCPARLPKRKNCAFYETAAEALSAGFRACKRCHPSSHAEEASATVKKLITLIEDAPERRWTEADIKAIGIDPSTARRQFKKRFGLTFTQYARTRRLGAAAQGLAKGESVIEAQLNAGYESASGFRAAFANTFGTAPAKTNHPPLFIDWTSSPLGPLFTVCDEQHLYMLEFTTRKNIERGFEKLRKVYKRAVIPGRTAITDQIEAELKAYFNGSLTDFNTPLSPTGTAFQNQVWKALQDIPYGESCAYSDLAVAIGNEKAVRAVASSNANNGLALIIPCHRVIAKGGGLGGYAGGLEKKRWLLAHEKRHKI